MLISRRRLVNRKKRPSWSIQDGVRTQFWSSLVTDRTPHAFPTSEENNAGGLGVACDCHFGSDACILERSLRGTDVARGTERPRPRPRPSRTILVKERHEVRGPKTTWVAVTLTSLFKRYSEMERLNAVTHSWTFRSSLGDWMGPDRAAKGLSVCSTYSRCSLTKSR
jgi:hypothetical protein